MSNYVDVEYINLLSSRLRNFKQKSQSLWSFSCPICGDSNTSKTKARGYIFQKKGEYFFFCHNCHASCSFKNFLCKLDTRLHDEYVMRRYADSSNSTSIINDSPRLVYKKRSILSHRYAQQNRKPQDSVLDGLLQLTKANTSNISKQYCSQRKISMKYHRVLYHCENFKAWLASINHEKADDVSAFPKLIIPFMDATNKVNSLQARSILPEDKTRYTTIKFNDLPLLYGLDRVDFSQPNYIFEGPLDSLFIPNSGAIAGSRGYYDYPLSQELTTFVYDNDPRNPDIRRSMEQAVMNGFQIVVWNSTRVEGIKDVNDMILREIDSPEIASIMRSHTYKGLKATLAITKWSKRK